MIQKREFLRYIEDNNFYELFIECGWNNPQGDTDLGCIEDDCIAYHFVQIAERNGFKIVKCEVNKTPNPSICRKIDHYLHRLANDYICIFYQPTIMRHLWLVPVNKTEKRDLVRVEYVNADQASFLYEKVSGFSFELGSRTTIVDVREKVQKAFIVDSERVTKRFYEEFRKQHKAFTAFITGIDDYIDEENKTRPKNKQVENKNKQWYASIMLNRLMFCYFIQRKRFLDGKTDYLRRKLQEVQEQEGDDQFYSFYRSFLIHLFHDGINTPRHDSPEFLKRYGRIPYLNGGLFGEHELEKTYKEIDISDEAFEKLFAFFDEWNWHLDTSLTASGKDINPDVLGYIFEQYINDRAAMGAYYTKEDITEYIGRNTIIPFLMDATKKADEQPFKSSGEVWQFLQGSGDDYIFDAVKKGKDEDIPEEIAIGIDSTKPNLLERRSHWNERTPEALALPTEIWRETIERLQRYKTIKTKIENGEITEINDFITYNLDIRKFTKDLLDKTEDHLLVKHFYEQLRKITILDPTCGSGAFLFAAMNILEPLYQVCIDRMEEWHKKNPHLFKEEIEEIDRKYRSNRQYFIYKSIILRNLYGVDIMVEATEIAKLRLFLKMVAVVEVDMRAENLGLDPLPDIDFNIRCGNTLVGYATEKELERDLIWGDMHANKEFRKKIEDGMDKAAHAFKQFKAVQFTQDEDMDAFKTAKEELRERLKELNDALSHRLYASTADATALKYDDWKVSHQPFHWLAEFYEIMHGNGGFDIVIGNPPYVEYNKKDKETGLALSDIYSIRSYQTKECSNLYAFCVERSKRIIGDKSHFGMIIPLSITCGDRMKKLRDFVNKAYNNKYIANYEIFPSKLFEGAFQRVSILLCNNIGKGSYITKLYRWYSVERPILFSKIVYTIADNIYSSFGFAKLYTKVHTKVIHSINSSYSIANYIQKRVSPLLIYYQEATNYWMKASMRTPYYCKNNVITAPAHGRFLYFDSEHSRNVIFALLNSSLFYCWYSSFSDGFHLTDSMVKTMPVKIDLFNNKNLQELASTLEEDIKTNSFITTRNTKNDNIVLESFKINLSKGIIDKIDKTLAEVYTISNEELDFIINYDIKYRMGDELNEE